MNSPPLDVMIVRLYHGNRVARNGENIHISHDALIVLVNIDYPGESVLTPMGVLVCQPNNVPESHITLSCVPLAPDKQVGSSQLTPLLPELVYLCLDDYSPFV